jgi:hypothetical protein
MGIPKRIKDRPFCTGRRHSIYRYDKADDSMLLYFNHRRMENPTKMVIHALTCFSQYRFLRAIELGFGIFAVIFAKNIFNDRNSTGFFFSLWLRVYVPG